MSGRELWARGRSFFKSAELDRELRDEFDAHIEMAVEDNLRSGLNRDEARRQQCIHRSLRFNRAAINYDVEVGGRGPLIAM